MTVTSDVRLTLTAEQQAVVTQPWDGWTLVTAGAGAGKTTTLTYRLEHLTAVEELEASEILVLSFSRSAVRELRERVDRLAVTARRVRAYTFDSWALSLLLQQDPGREDLTSLSFDKRIKMATEAIEAGLIEQTEIGRPAHVVIDEVQDLVGVRRELVEALLDRFGGDSGFTVVGDAAQAIYGFQVSDTRERAAETNRFFDWLRSSFGVELVELRLTDNFRAVTSEARLALPYGRRLQDLPREQSDADAKATAIHYELRALLERVIDFGSFDDGFVRDSLLDYAGTTAILCRDNGQALLLSKELGDNGVDHRIQRSARDRLAPEWLADILVATSAAAIAEDRFLEIMTTLTTPDGLDVTRAWRSMLRVAGARGQLDLSSLHRAIAEDRLPDELTCQFAHRITVSTIHRAKGLEFDRVLVLTPGALPDGRADNDPPAEARLLYVALTRARHDLYRISRDRDWMVRKFAHGYPPMERWYRGGGRGPQARWKRYGMEAAGLDINREVPAGADEPTSDPVGTQRYLTDCVRSGDAVELRRLHDLPMSAIETPQYGLFHEGRPIGSTSERFRQDLWRLLKVSRDWKVERWPLRITELRIDALETVAGSPAVAKRFGLNDRGVWLAPRLCGLGRFEWHGGSSELEGGFDA
ncbi:UvrD-like helicase family protein [Kribbella voronezhensis]|uniref:DNA 3'-5' helicase n=1 Tax=Kribbella voronezhensis TaxID=2512212 RepID=A0A4R7SXG8_9ACTN|nr:ATP-dependent helicase [Kribbella voronezhensis]TDU83157.1 UvrD-like helicase family protein [Kribbella voronezhensis]